MNEETTTGETGESGNICADNGFIWEGAVQKLDGRNTHKSSKGEGNIEYRPDRHRR